MGYFLYAHTVFVFPFAGFGVARQRDRSRAVVRAAGYAGSRGSSPGAVSRPFRRRVHGTAHLPRLPARIAACVCLQQPTGRSSSFADAVILHFSCMLLRLQCVRFTHLGEQLRRAGRHQQALAIEVYVLPGCPLHRALWLDLDSGATAATAADATSSSSRLPENALLLERWQLDTLTVLQSTSSSSCLRPGSLTALLNSLRSYLHFSQLSAWLVRSGGRSPAALHYRVMPLQEAMRPWQGPCERHDFPFMALTDVGGSYGTAELGTPNPCSAQRLLRLSVTAAPRNSASAPKVSSKLSKLVSY